MKYEYIGDVLYFYFFGEFDNLFVTKIKQTCVDLITQYQPKKVKFDFREVSFIDSTGIGFLLARYKQLKQMGGEIIVCNLSCVNQRLFAMSGIFQIIDHEQNEVRL